MQKVIAYGPEILALEDHFEGESIILNGYQRYFITIDDTLYCDFMQSEHTWMVGRVYEISEEDMSKFSSVYPDEYSKTHITIDERDVEPIAETAITFAGTNNPVRKPLTEPTQSAYTLYENLALSISDQFAFQFALSTHSNLDVAKLDILTSYYRYLEEIDLFKCRKEILSTNSNTSRQ